MSRWLLWAGALTVALVVLAIGVGFHVWSGGNARHPSEAAVPAFVGSDTCAGCHRAQSELWRKSQHRRAMAHATPDSVLGDFNGTSFENFGLRSRFFRKDAKYFVETDGPDGKLGTFEIKYTFGVEPLQQYLIEFPDGRLQALTIAWDSRPKAEGGQRWFHLYPNEEIRHDDVLHWTKLNQNWNFMCAECHSTGVHKNYDAQHDRFATTWAEISVGCEACHGRGSRHVGWAHYRASWWPFGKQDDPAKGLIVRFDERRNVVWRHDPKSGSPERNWPPTQLRKEVETCGLCHARRAQFSEDWIPGRWLSDTHVVSLIARGLYEADGQMRDEVYNYGSFKQSKMFAAGVTCSDCHDPHSAKLRADGDAVCAQCHLPQKYETASHRRHEAAQPQLTCASCHMPKRTYMVVDPRHDHGFRVPRPDISMKASVPNACNDCHTDRSAQWSAAAIEQWYGPIRKGFQKYAEAFDASWAGRADASALLAAVAGDRQAPAIARASALSELASHPSPTEIVLARSQLSQADPAVRLGALDVLERLPAPQVWPLIAPLLSDPVRGVRIRAAEILAAVPGASLPAADRERFDRAAAEFVAAQRLNADRPEARLTLGNFYARRGRAADAEAEYKAALRLSPQFWSATVNLADLYRETGQDGQGEAVLRAAVQSAPQDARLHYALGLTLTRLKRPDEALSELRRAAELAPEHARYGYVYAVALRTAGRREEAISILKSSLARHPGDRDTLIALITFHRDVGDAVTALGYAEQLARLTPNDANLSRMIEEFRNQAKKP